MTREWRDAAARLTADPEIFFPDPSDITTALQARAVCARCDVVEQCLRYALATRQSEGIWGGLSPRARRDMKRIPECRDCGRDAPAKNYYCEPCGIKRRAATQRTYDINRRAAGDRHRATEAAR